MAGKLSQSDVGYRSATTQEQATEHVCGTCSFFTYDFEHGRHTCQVVAPPIEVTGWCILWRRAAAKERTI